MPDISLGVHRLARIGRRRFSEDRAEAVLRFLGHPSRVTARTSRPVTALSLRCDECDRQFLLPMRLGRHKKSKHDRSSAA